jgi:membrane fusion protein (multidrug efflux system)
MKTSKINAIVLIALLAISASGCGTGEASVTKSDEESLPAALPVFVAFPTTMDVFASYEMATNIASDAEAAVLARVAGQVVEILVEEGDRVSKGQVLARLDGDRPRLEMLEAKANLEQMTREYDRQKELQEQGLVSAASFDGLKFGLDSLRAIYQLQKLNYDYTSIRATIAGVVSSRDIKVGTNIEVSEVAFTVTDTSRLVAYLNIPQTELSKFSPGHEAALSVDSMPDTQFQGVVARISPTIDTRSGTFRATVYIDNADGDLAPGMFGRFIIAYEKHANALVVPAAAVVREDNESVVYVVTDGAAVRRAIEAGIQSAGMVEILDGLEKNEEIVVTGLTGLRDGSRVVASTGVTGSASS